MKIVVIRDDGKSTEYENVVDYGIIDIEEVKQACESADVDYSEDILEEVKRRTGDADHLLTYDELVDICCEFR